MATQNYSGAKVLDRVADQKRSFTMSINAKPQGRIVFQLTYGERLERRDGSYRYQIYLTSLPPLDLQQDTMSVEVKIKETLGITNMTITPTNTNNNWVAGTSDVKLDWSPQAGGDPSVMQEGIRVEYSVEERRNEIQMLCGHFIHCYTPDKITRDKFLIFVLDVSSSMDMDGPAKLNSLKSAMEQILTKMISSTDYFSIITFYGRVDKWADNGGDLTSNGIFKGDDRMKANEYVKTLTTHPATNINDALLEGITQAEQSKTFPVLKSLAPMIAFLTDGQDTQTSADSILRNVQEKNTEKIPILTLGFGAGASMDLLQKLSAQTNSMSRAITEGADSQSQLEDFFKEIERPTLSNVQFSYSGNVKQDSLSEVSQGQMFSGGEYVTGGETEDDTGELDVSVSADSRDGRVTSKTTLKQEKSSTDQ